MRPLLQLKEVSRTFSVRGKPKIAAVHKVSLSLQPGETLGLVGQSGSGKSTLARLAARLLDVSAGSIWLDGRDITGVKGRKLRAVYQQMQMVFQAPAASFDPRKTLGDGIGERLRNQGYSKQEVEKQVERLLDQCGLEREYARRYPHQVSGGECQRAAFARALAGKPRLLLLDEPTSALDGITQQQMLELLAQWRERKQLSYLLICHNLALVERFCHRVVVMDQGEIVEQGTPEQVIYHPMSPVAQRLADAATM